MSCLGIDVSSTVQGSELEHITVEGIEATDALGRAICQSQLTVRCEGVAPLNLDLKLSPDDLEPVFSGAAWAGTVLWRAAAVLVDRAFLGADAVQIKGRTCIELGCGLGVPGMACARLGAKNVALTEQQLDLCGNQWRGIYSRHRADAVAGTWGVQNFDFHTGRSSTSSQGTWRPTFPRGKTCGRSRSPGRAPAPKP